MVKVKGVSGAVMKAMGIFSGVQVFSILCSMVRTKLVALWIGATGVGLFGLYYSALDIINTVSQLGLRNSTVPEIVGAKTPGLLRRICWLVRRWCWALGVLGAFLTLVFSPLLSWLTFGDYDHTLGFIALSITVFFNAILTSEMSILQGSNMLRQMAQASLWGMIAGLAVSIPLFYYLRIDSIVPSFLVYSVTTAGAAWIMRRRVEPPKPKPTFKESIAEGDKFVKLGVYMTISSFVTLAASYIFKVYLNEYEDIDTVGFYQAGYTLVDRYIGLVFAAISMEYYPRLCGVVNSRRRTSLFVSHENEIAMLVILPVATIFMAMDDFIIRLFYSSDFEIAAPFVSWALAGTVFRAFSWCMAFEILARGDGLTYIVTESLSAVAYVALNIAGWRVWGYAGLGVAYAVWYLLYTVIVGVVYFRKYGLSVNSKIILLTITTAAVTIGCAAARSYGLRWVVIIVAVGTSIFSLRGLSRLLFSRNNSQKVL